MYQASHMGCYMWKSPILTVTTLTVAVRVRVPHRVQVPLLVIHNFAIVQGSTSALFFNL